MRVPIVMSLLLVVSIQAGCATRALWGVEGTTVRAASPVGLGKPDEVEAVATDETGRLLVALTYTGGSRYLALCPSTAPVGTEAPLIALIEVPDAHDTTHEDEMTQEDFLALGRGLAPDSSWTSLRSVGAAEPFAAESYRIVWGRLERRAPEGSYDVLCRFPGKAAGSGDRPAPRRSKGGTLARLVATPFALTIDVVSLPFVLLSYLRR